MGLYKKKPTLAELYADDNTLFSGLSVPEGVDTTKLVPMLLVELGPLQTIFEDAESAAAYIPVWSYCHAEPWAKMLAALSAVYNPIHNYDRTDTETETVTGERSETVTGTGSGSVTGSGSDTTTKQTQGFNSSDYVNKDKDTVTLGSKSETEAESETETAESSETGRERTLTSSGNIGVTTAQQMITAEVDMRAQFNMYKIIVEAFKADLCVGVW